MIKLKNIEKYKTMIKEIEEEARGAVSLLISVVCVHQKDVRFDTALARDSLKL